MTWKLTGVAIALAGAAGIVIGQEPVSVSKTPPMVEKVVPDAERHVGAKKPEPWLGIDVSKPDPAVHAQLREIPIGVGFVLTKVAAESPAEVSGLKPYDFVWKMEDQLLINRCQFGALLSMREIGDEVTLTIQRGGENQEVVLEVGRRPDDEKGRDRADVRVMSPGAPGLPTQRHDLVRKVAELTDDEGAVRIWREGEGYGWAEFDEFDLEISSGTLAGVAEESFPPKMDPTLKRKLQALVRGYEQAERNREAKGRSPRVRRVPTEGSGR